MGNILGNEKAEPFLTPLNPLNWVTLPFVVDWICGAHHQEFVDEDEEFSFSVLAFMLEVNK